MLRGDTPITRLPDPGDVNDGWRVWGIGMRVSANPTDQDLARQAVYQKYFREDKSTYADIHKSLLLWIQPQPGRYGDVPSGLNDPADQGLGLPGWLEPIRECKR